MTSSAAKPICELAIVVLTSPIEHRGRMLPAGSQGTVVYVYRGGEYYEVEFTEPFQCTVTVPHDSVSA